MTETIAVHLDKHGSFRVELDEYTRVLNGCNFPPYSRDLSMTRASKPWSVEDLQLLIFSATGIDYTDVESRTALIIVCADIHAFTDDFGKSGKGSGVAMSKWIKPDTEVHVPRPDNADTTTSSGFEDQTPVHRLEKPRPGDSGVHTSMLRPPTGKKFVKPRMTQAPAAGQPVMQWREIPVVNEAGTTAWILVHSCILAAEQSDGSWTAYGVDENGHTSEIVTGVNFDEARHAGEAYHNAHPVRIR